MMILTMMLFLLRLRCRERIVGNDLTEICSEFETRSDRGSLVSTTVAETAGARLVKSLFKYQKHSARLETLKYKTGQPSGHQNKVWPRIKFSVGEIFLSFFFFLI